MTIRSIIFIAAGSLAAFLSLGCATSPASKASTAPFYRGVDLSMLPHFEAAGVVYRDAQPIADLPTWAVRRGVNLIRLRLFVDPNPDYAATAGATQNLADTIQMARRAKAAGAAVLLDLHYSDTWADPEKQTKPAAWAARTGEALAAKVEQYTADTLRAFAAAGVAPEMVQIGNEIAPGMLWPDGKLVYEPATEDESWRRFAALVNAGIRGVRAADGTGRKTDVLIHIHGGGRPGLPPWFFNRFARHVTDFQFIGLSFYPGNRETLAALRDNLHALAATHPQGILVVETAYPHAPLPELYAADFVQPTTPEGQRQFLLDLTKLLRDVPAGKGRGWVYWYPESVPLPNQWVWHGGRAALFDANGEALPAWDAFNPAGELSGD
jgi:arabinogalactan endo-1,4-beta-galactosidase